MQKNLEATIIYVDFTKAFDFIYIGKMEQILLAYGQPKETIAAIMMLYTGWNNKIVVLKKTTLQLYFKTFIEKINSGNLIM